MEKKSNIIDLLKDKNKEIDPCELYDLIVKIHSFLHLTPNDDGIDYGWEVNAQQEKMELYEEKKKDEEQTIVGINGLGNKGKTFILQKLSGFSFQTGFTAITEGLSIKYDQRKPVLYFDSAGSQSPILETEDFQLGMEGVSDKEAQEKITEIARDKGVTEIFLQNFILNNAHVIIVVVGQLTFSEQKLLNRIQSNFSKVKTKIDKLFVVHNLFNFFEREQVEDYVENVLKQSLTFQVEEQTIEDFNTEKKKPEINRKIFRQVINTDKNKQKSIIHLLMANDSNQSKAGQYYNFSTIQYLKKEIINITKRKKFDVLEKVKSFLHSSSPVIFDNLIPKDKIIIEGRKIYIDLPESEIKLKKCLVDELGLSNFYSNIWSPPFEWFIEEGANKIKILLELPGYKPENKPKINFSKTEEGINIITISGEKPDSDIIQSNDLIFTDTIKKGRYKAVVKLESDILIKTDDVEEKYLDKGLYEYIIGIEFLNDHEDEEIEF